jgi:hypothetical protein
MQEQDQRLPSERRLPLEELVDAVERVGRRLTGCGRN